MQALLRRRKGGGEDVTSAGPASQLTKISWLQWYQFKFAKSRLRVAMEVVNAIMSLLSVGVYVYDTYIPAPSASQTIYFVSSITFSIEYVARMLAAKNLLKYLLWDWAVIDLITIVFGYLYFAEADLGTGLGFIRVMRIFQVVRLLKAMTAGVLKYSHRSAQPMQLEFVKRSLELGLTMVGVVFISGCVFYELELNSQPVQLHTAVYWACVTIATIGYGDYAPTTAIGQLIFPVIILIIILVLPQKISNLSEVMQSFTRYMRASFTSRGFGHHVVLTGHVTYVSAQTFISEFFHPDRGYQDLDVIMLRSCDPEPQLVITMNNAQWDRRIKYLHGSPFRAEDLARADTGYALAVFVMANKFAADPAAEDRRTLLTVLAIGQYLRQFCGQDTVAAPRVVSWGNTSWKGRYNMSATVNHPHIVVQFLLNSTLDNAIALLQTGASHPPELGLLPLEVSPFPVCVGHLRASLLGASMHTPGLITLISNLCISCSMERKRLFGVEDLSLLSNCGWLSEYLHGAGIEIYDVTFPESYHGMTFKKAALKLWEEEQVILIGLRFPNHEDAKQRFDVKLAPLCDPHLPTTSTAGDPYSGGPLSPGDGAFGAPYTPQFGAGVGFPGAGPCGAVPPTPGCPFGGLGLAGGVTGGGPGSGVPHTNSATSYLSRSHTLDSRRVVDAATIGYILNDDALVLGSATLGFKSALDPHDDPGVMRPGAYQQAAPILRAATMSRGPSTAGGRHKRHTGAAGHHGSMGRSGCGDSGAHSVPATPAAVSGTLPEVGLNGPAAVHAGQPGTVTGSGRYFPGVITQLLNSLSRSAASSFGRSGSLEHKAQGAQLQAADGRNQAASGHGRAAGGGPAEVVTHPGTAGHPPPPPGASVVVVDGGAQSSSPEWAPASVAALPQPALLPSANSPAVLCTVSPGHASPADHAVRSIAEVAAAAVRAVPGQGVPLDSHQAPHAVQNPLFSPRGTQEGTGGASARLGPGPVLASRSLPAHGMAARAANQELGPAEAAEAAAGLSPPEGITTSGQEPGGAGGGLTAAAIRQRFIDSPRAGSAGAGGGASSSRLGSGVMVSGGHPSESTSVGSLPPYNSTAGRRRHGAEPPMPPATARASPTDISRLQHARAAAAGAASGLESAAQPTLWQAAAGSNHNSSSSSDGESMLPVPPSHARRSAAGAPPAAASAVGTQGGQHLPTAFSAPAHNYERDSAVPEAEAEAEDVFNEEAPGRVPWGQTRSERMRRAPSSARSDPGSNSARSLGGTGTGDGAESAGGDADSAAANVGAGPFFHRQSGRRRTGAELWTIARESYSDTYSTGVSRPVSSVNVLGGGGACRALQHPSPGPEPQSATGMETLPALQRRSWLAPALAESEEAAAQATRDSPRTPSLNAAPGDATGSLRHLASAGPEVGIRTPLSVLAAGAGPSSASMHAASAPPAQVESPTSPAPSLSRKDASETGGRLGGRTSITNGIFGKASLSRASAALADLFHHHHIKPQSSGSATAQGAREPSTAAERAGSAEQEPSPKDAIGRGGGGGSGVVGAGDRTNTGGSAGGAGGDRRERQGSGGGAGAERAEAGAGPSSVPREGGGARLMAVLNHLRANAAAGGSAGAAAPLGTRTARQQGIKVSTNARDMNALAAVSSRTYKKVATKGRSLVARQQSRMTGWAAAAAVASQQQSASQPQLAGAAPAAAAAFAGAPTPGPQGTSAGGAPTPLSMLGHPSALPDVNLLHAPVTPHVRTLTTLADGPALDSPVIISGSSSFSQLPQIIAAIRSAPPVGAARHFRTCPIVIIDDSKTNPSNPFKALLGESLLGAIARVPGALPHRILVLRCNPLHVSDLEKLNVQPGGFVHALVVPNTDLYSEEAVVGTEPALADGQVLLVADALRCYCEQSDCRLGVVSEILALLNCSYALPLCLSEGPYRGGAHMPPDLVPAATSQHSLFAAHSFNALFARHASGRHRNMHEHMQTVRLQESRQEAYMQHLLSGMPHLSPALATGHILMQNFMDALFCQTIFNPMMLQILLKMLYCWDEPEEWQPALQPPPAHGGGGFGGPHGYAGAYPYGPYGPSTVMPVSPYLNPQLQHQQHQAWAAAQHAGAAPHLTSTQQSVFAQQAYQQQSFLSGSALTSAAPSLLPPTSAQPSQAHMSPYPQPPSQAQPSPQAQPQASMWPPHGRAPLPAQWCHTPSHLSAGMVSAASSQYGAAAVPAGSAGPGLPAAALVAQGLSRAGGPKAAAPGRTQGTASPAPGPGGLGTAPGGLHRADSHLASAVLQATATALGMGMGSMERATSASLPPQPQQPPMASADSSPMRRRGAARGGSFGSTVMTTPRSTSSGAQSEHPAPTVVQMQPLYTRTASGAGADAAVATDAAGAAAAVAEGTELREGAYDAAAASHGVAEITPAGPVVEGKSRRGSSFLNHDRTSSGSGRDVATPRTDPLAAAAQQAAANGAGAFTPQVPSPAGPFTHSARATSATAVAAPDSRLARPPLAPGPGLLMPPPPGSRLSGPRQWQPRDGSRSHIQLPPPPGQQQQQLGGPMQPPPALQVPHTASLERVAALSAASASALSLGGESSLLSPSGGRFSSLQPSQQLLMPGCASGMGVGPSGRSLQVTIPEDPTSTASASAATAAAAGPHVPPPTRSAPAAAETGHGAGPPPAAALLSPVKAAAGASTTVRIFCFNYAALLDRMAGLASRLHSAQCTASLRLVMDTSGGAVTRGGQGSPTRIGSLAAEGATGGSARVGADGGGWDKFDQMAAEVVPNADFATVEGLAAAGIEPGDLGQYGTGRQPVPAVTFGALFQVLVAHYDMLPLGLYRRDNGSNHRIDTHSRRAYNGHALRTADNTVDRTAAGGGGGGDRSYLGAALDAVLRAGGGGGGGADGGGGGRGTSAGGGGGGRPALSRSGTNEGLSGHAKRQGSGMPYVYTKPAGDTTWLRSTDDVYVLTSAAVVLRLLGSEMAL
ncbi:hypothetical protein CHLRE_02g146300v5 [Chlamydomonas reinhardtii]|uniref:Ion transport domain-containing protein n=1 Tax=Chlamydomonas reinhardtii TaxID=3055 RepID=A0A2K3E3R5_CHLRE|nr:uncharacterized protein CHLRE_02g146300v5 [Chlamydomonas reinhardtii]PNW87416.1 hypothetical protein CHLRE_02g146300v5 [Chlamydomonas reinhardtii]